MKSPQKLLFLFASSVAFPFFAAADGSTVPTLGIANVHLRDRNEGSDSSGLGWARFASGKGNALFLATGILLPLVTDKAAGREQTLRTLDALSVSTLLSSGLKVLTHERRPDGSDFASFPSGHAAAAFTVATMEARFHPRQALLWYGGATVIAASRVVLHRHYTRDVVAGALLGFGSARLELSEKRGLILRPFIHGEEPNLRTTGLSLGRTW